MLMKKPTAELVAEIDALQGMRAEEIKERYSGLLGAELECCANCCILRAEVAYRLQERFYGIRLGDDIVKAIEAAGEPAENAKRLLAGTRIVRRWKGEDHEIEMRADGSIDYRGEMYKSLSAVARRITGTNWNGKLFFGLKK